MSTDWEPHINAVTSTRFFHGLMRDVMTRYIAIDVALGLLILSPCVEDVVRGCIDIGVEL